MAISFDEYLNEQKQSNRYTPEYNLDEGKIWDKIRGADKEKAGAVVKINFTDEKVVKHISDILEARATLTSDQTLSSSKNFSEMVQEQIAIYVNTLAKLFNKNHGHKVVKNKNDHELWYIFEKYNDKDPYAYAKSFIRSIEAQGDGVNAISFLAEICGKPTDTEFTKRELEDSKKANNTFNDPDKKPEDIVGSNFIVNVTKSIYNKVKNILDKNDEFAKKGNLITVFSIPYKISDDSIVKLAEELKKENDNATAGNFFDKLASVANKNIVDFLNQLDAEGVKDYLGIVPVKTYGFNLYFKDRDTAEQAAEGLNQDGTDIKVSERKRYEGKIVNRPKVLTDAVTLSNGVTLAGISEAGSWLMGTRFAVEHVVGLIGDIYPEAKTAREVKIATVKVDDDWIKNKLLNADNNTEFYMAEQLKNRVIKPLVDHGKENFISASSEGSSLVFIFTGNTSTDNIETYLNGIVPASKITVRRGSFTQGEIEGHQSLMAKLSKNFTGSKATEEETAAIREKFTSLFEAASKWIKKDQNDAQKAADAEAENAANAPGALAIQFIFDKFKKLSSQAKSNLLSAIDTIPLAESFAMNLYDYLMESLHLNEAILDDKLNDEQKAKLAELKEKDPEQYKALRRQYLEKALSKKTEKPEKPTADPNAKKATEKKTTAQKATKAAVINTPKGKISFQDVINNPEEVDSKALLTLIAVKIQTIMEVIKDKTQSEIEVKLGEDFSIIIKYQAKAKDRIEKYVNDLKAASNGIIEIKGAKNP